MARTAKRDYTIVSGTYSPFQSFLTPIKQFFLDVEGFGRLLCYCFLHYLLDLSLSKNIIFLHQENLFFSWLHLIHFSQNNM